VRSGRGTGAIRCLLACNRRLALPQAPKSSRKKPATAATGALRHGTEPWPRLDFRARDPAAGEFFSSLLSAPARLFPGAATKALENRLPARVTACAHCLRPLPLRLTIGAVRKSRTASLCAHCPAPTRIHYAPTDVAAGDQQDCEELAEKPPQRANTGEVEPAQPSSGKASLPPACVRNPGMHGVS
jgi:hypothetical protein